MATTRGVSGETATPVTLSNPEEHPREYSVDDGTVTIDTEHFNALDYAAAQDAAMLAATRNFAGRTNSQVNTLRQRIDWRIVSNGSEPYRPDERVEEHQTASGNYSDQDLQSSAGYCADKSQPEPSNEPHSDTTSQQESPSSQAACPMRTPQRASGNAEPNHTPKRGSDGSVMSDNVKLASIKAPSALQASPDSNDKVSPNSRRRRRPVDLTINGIAKLNVHADDTHGVKEYLSNGKWFQLMGDENPDTIEEIRPVGKPERTLRLTGKWRSER